MSRKILAAAGDGIQAECTEMYPSGIGHSDLVVTKAHNMTQAKHVYLSSLPKYSTGKEQVLHASMYTITHRNGICLFWGERSIIERPDHIKN